MKISELIDKLKDLQRQLGDIRVGYDLGVMEFNGEFTVEKRSDGDVLSLEGEYS